MSDRLRGGSTSHPSPMKKGGSDEDREWSNHEDEHAERTFAHRTASSEIPYQAHDDHQSTDRDTVPALVGSRQNPPKVCDEEGGIDCQIENARCQRQPSLLETPEGSHRPSHPNVVATLGRDGAGELGDHESGGETPNQRGDQDQQDRSGVSGRADRLLEPIRTARGHEVGGGDQGPESNASFLSDL